MTIEQKICKIEQALCSNKVLFYSTEAKFPTTGNSNNLYIDSSGPTLYYWDGDSYELFLDSFSIEDTTSIDLEGDGTPENPLTATVKISEEVGNILVINSDGLFVPAGGGGGSFSLVHEDSPTVDLEGEGTEDEPLIAEVILSDDFNQDIEEREDGLYAPGFYIEVTKTELDDFIADGALEEGATYKVSETDIPLYGGSTIYLKAIEGDRLDISGIGIFYNPKYDVHPIWERYSTITITLQSNIFTLGETITANNGATATIHDDARGLIIPISGDWSAATSITGNSSGRTATVTDFLENAGYSIGDKVIWGGMVWENLTGEIGTNIDAFLLDNTNWVQIPYDEDDYRIVYDEIKYDYANDTIIYRKDTDNNIVSTSVISNTLIDDWYSIVSNPIKGFQWGNDAVIGNKITDSYFEIINQKASLVADNILQSTSAIYNLYMNEGDFSFNTLTKSRISALFLHDFYYRNNIFDGKSYSQGSCFAYIIVEDNRFSNVSYCINNRISNTIVAYNTIESASYISGNFRNCGISKNVLMSDGSIVGNAFTGVYDDSGYSANCITRNIISNRSTISNNRQLTVGQVGSVSKNTVDLDSSISSNTLNGGAYIYRNKLHFSNIGSNNLSPITGSAGAIEFNDLSSYANITTNTGQIYIGYNQLSTYSNITGNISTLNFSGEINYNKLHGQSYINLNKFNAFGSSIHYNVLNYSTITYLECNDTFFMRENYLDSAVYNSKYPTYLVMGNNSIYDCRINQDEYWVTIQKDVTGAAGAGAVGALTIQKYTVPTNFFIDEVWTDLRVGITDGGGAAINLGLEVDGVTSGLDNTSGLISTLNNTITKIICSSFVPTTNNRELVMSVTGAAIGPGTLYIKIKLKKLKRIAFS